MAVLDVLDAIRDRADTVAGITSAYRGIPEKAPVDAKLPAALVYLDPDRNGAIVHGGIEVWIYPVRVDILVKRAGDIMGEEAAAIPYLEAFVTALRGQTNLTGDGAVMPDSEYRVGTLALYDNVYIGATWIGSIEQQFEAASQMAP